MTNYSEYLPKNERPLITALLKEIISRGVSITINNGEEYIITSDKLSELQPELAGTGEDWISFEGGCFYLIYNNGSDDDPMVAISDYSDNPLCDEIYNRLSAKYGE